MLGIAVTQSGGCQSIACIVDGHRTEHNLIASVHIDIGYGEVMESITKPR